MKIKIKVLEDKQNKIKRTSSKEYALTGGLNMKLTEKHIEDFFKTLIEIFETRYEVKIKYKLIEKK